MVREHRVGSFVVYASPRYALLHDDPRSFQEARGEEFDTVYDFVSMLQARVMYSPTRWRSTTLYPRGLLLAWFHSRAREVNEKETSLLWEINQFEPLSVFLSQVSIDTLTKHDAFSPVCDGICKKEREAQGVV